jgi:hypothetical protein
VFAALGVRQGEFNWLLSEFELNVNPPGFPAHARPGRILWLSGEELSAIVVAHDVQFIWGVLSGSRDGVTLDPAGLAPYRSPMAMTRYGGQACGCNIHSRDVEIVCWDSSATLLLSRDDDLTRRFRAYFPEAVDLDEYNRRPGREL